MKVEQKLAGFAHGRAQNQKVKMGEIVMERSRIAALRSSKTVEPSQWGAILPGLL